MILIQNIYGFTGVTRFKENPGHPHRQLIYILETHIVTLTYESDLFAISSEALLVSEFWLRKYHLDTSASPRKYFTLVI